MLWVMKPSICSTNEFIFLIPDIEEEIIWAVLKIMNDCTWNLKFGERPKKAEHAKYCQNSSDIYPEWLSGDQETGISKIFNI